MKAEHARPKDLPEYDNPPVTEVVCGVLFKRLERFRLLHFGLLWQKIRKDFPTFQETAPLVPAIELYGSEEEQDAQLQFAFGDIPLPRIWFLDAAGTGLLQLQRDRLLYNWKKNKPADAYPRYHVVIEKFKRQIATFEDFLKEHQLDTIEPLQYEMTYVNQIPQGEGWTNLSELGSVFRGHQWQAREGDFLPPIEHATYKSSFLLPENKGRLHVSIRDGKRVGDNQPVLLFELTTRGFPGDASPNAMWPWFDNAREWIVRAFAELTASEIQEKVWRRTR
jgi:uncharacterized protein (TIGR04255 family)